MSTPKRELMFLINTHGRTEDEIVEEGMRRLEEWRAKKAAEERRHETPDGGTTTK